MSDSKYGRIFTEADVLEVVRHWTGVRPTSERLSECIEARIETTFPAGEPVFVLRAKDELAPVAMLAYALDAEARSLWSVADGVWFDRRAVVDWQLANPSLVREPD